MLIVNHSTEFNSSSHELNDIVDLFDKYKKHFTA